MAVRKISIQSFIIYVFRTNYMHNYQAAKNDLIGREFFDDPYVYQRHYRGDEPKELYALSKRLNWTDNQYLELINSVRGAKITSRFWTNELSNYIDTVQLTDFNLDIVYKLYYLRANLSTSQVKEKTIQKIKSLDPMQQLTVIDGILSSNHRPLYGLFSLQRGWTKPCLGHGSFKILANMRKSLKEQVIEYISKQPVSDQLKLVSECLKVGTPLNKLFTTQRGFFKVSMRHGTLKKLSDMRVRLERSSVTLSPPKTMSKTNVLKQEKLSLVDRLKAIGHSMMDVPDELCCPISMEIMSEPIRLGSRADAYCERKNLKAHIDKSKMSTPDRFICPVTSDTLLRVGVLDIVDEEMRQKCESYVEEQESKYREKQMHQPNLSFL